MLRFDQLDKRITIWMARNGILILRISVGIVFLWFGALKFFPSINQADEIAARTITALTGGLLKPNISVPLLTIWECLIGLGLLSGLFLRATIFLLFLQMAGTFMPLFLFPGETWIIFPIAPTLEGQYIIKNVVLISAAMVIGATVRGGRLTAKPVSEVVATGENV